MCAEQVCRWRPAGDGGGGGGGPLRHFAQHGPVGRILAYGRRDDVASRLPSQCQRVRRPGWQRCRCFISGLCHAQARPGGRQNAPIGANHASSPLDRQAAECLHAQPRVWRSGTSAKWLLETFYVARCVFWAALRLRKGPVLTSASPRGYNITAAEASALASGADVLARRLRRLAAAHRQWRASAPLRASPVTASYSEQCCAALVGGARARRARRGA